MAFNTTKLRRVAITIVSTVAFFALSANPALAPFADDFESFPAGERWPDGTVHGGWRAVFDGYGQNTVAVDGSKVLRLSPQPAQSSGETHAGLVVSTQEYGNVDLTARLRTTEQLRQPDPNPWEVAWLVWSYRDSTHFYYLALKPNGWELGKADPAYPGAQRFLGGDFAPTFAVGPWHSAEVTQQGNTITVWGNGRRLGQVVDDEQPYTSGSIGLYCEDAAVHFDDVRVS
jgi:hypothetical protein